MAACVDELSDGQIISGRDCLPTIFVAVYICVAAVDELSRVSWSDRLLGR